MSEVLLTRGRKVGIMESSCGSGARQGASSQLFSRTHLVHMWLPTAQSVLLTLNRTEMTFLSHLKAKFIPQPHLHLS